MTPQELLESQRGSYLIAKAFHYAAQQIARFPEERQAGSDASDMLFMLNGCFPDLAATFRENDRQWAEVHKPRAVSLASRGEGTPDAGDGA